MNVSTITIGNRVIGEGYPIYVIAEVGLNHNGKFAWAKQLVVEAAKTGADAVKFQLFSAEHLFTKKNAFAYDLFKGYELQPSQWKELAGFARKVGITFLATPLDEKSADFLDSLRVPAFKIASGDLTHVPLLSYTAKKGKPMIVSTGAGEMKDIKQAVKTIFSTGNKQLVLLHCISNYPTQPQDAHLEMIQKLRKTFHVPTGFSDHTIGFAIPIGAAALGAVVIEEHFTLDNTAPGPDHQLSLIPKDMTILVESIRKVEVAVAKGFKGKRPDAKERFGARRTIIAAQDIPKGTKITARMLKVVRAGNRGLAPSHFEKVIGKTSKKSIEAEEPLFQNSLV